MRTDGLGRIEGGNDEMIEYAYVDQLQRAGNGAGDGDVRARGTAVAGRVVVREEHGGGIVAQRGLDEFAHGDRRVVHGAAEEFFEGDQASAIVEPGGGEHFMLVFAQAQAKPVGQICMVVEPLAGTSGATLDGTQRLLYAAIVPQVGGGFSGIPLIHVSVRSVSQLQTIHITTWRNSFGGSSAPSLAVYGTYMSSQLFGDDTLDRGRDTLGMNTFGSRLRKLRTERGLTQEQLALEIGVTKGAVSQWELDGNEPEFDSLKIIREILGGSLDDLICGDGTRDSDVAIPSTKELALLQRLRELPAKKRAAVLALFDL